MYRRAQLRCCFERLKEVVPCPSGRHTTKGLLASASHLIRVRMTLISSAAERCIQQMYNVLEINEKRKNRLELANLRRKPTVHEGSPKCTIVHCLRLFESDNVLASGL